MKLLLFMPFFLILNFTVRGNDTINKTDSAGSKQGYWIIRNDVRKLQNYSADAVVDEGCYVNSKKEGLWKTHFPNGTLKSEVAYKNGRPRGEAIMYNETGCTLE